MDFFEMIFDAALDYASSCISFEPVQFIIISAAVLLLVVIPISKIFHIGD